MSAFTQRPCYFSKIAKEIEFYESRMMKHTRELMGPWPSSLESSFRKAMDNDSFVSIKVYIEDDAPSLLDMKASIAKTSENFFSDAQITDMIASVALGATRLTHLIHHAAVGMNPSPEDIYFVRIATEIELHDLRMMKHTGELMSTWPPGVDSYGSALMDADLFFYIKLYIEDNAFSMLDIQKALTNTSEDFFSDEQRNDAIPSVAIGATRLMYREATAAAHAAAVRI
jgi:hypothetical protein